MSDVLAYDVNSSRWHLSVLVALMAVAMLILPHAARAQQDAVASGAAIAALGTTPGRAACAACHLVTGAGQPDVGIPRLAGLTESYIAAQLDYFASGARQNAAMGPYAMALSPAQRNEVAAYFASLPLPGAHDPLPVHAALIARGERIFRNGDGVRGLLACSQCHGPSGEGVGNFSPRLAGQSDPYVQSQLADWRSGALRDPKGIFMRSVAGHLTEPDIEAVAAYVASLTNAGGKP